MSKIINLGCGNAPLDGAVNHDIYKHSPHVDVAWDLNCIPWQLGSDYDKVIAIDVMEHLKIDIRLWMNETWKMLKPHGQAIIRVPRYDHPNAFIDPTHQRFFAPETLSYWCPGQEMHEKYGKFYFGEDMMWWGFEVEVTEDSINYCLTKIPK
jgi:hypothetical protein